MPESEPHGCLAAILSVFGIRFAVHSTARDQFSHLETMAFSTTRNGQGVVSERSQSPEIQSEKYSVGGNEAEETPEPVELPFRLRDDFLSAAELSFYRVLTKALDGSYLVCPKVNLADVFFVIRPNENQAFRNKIDRKHVDFLICDYTTMRPILGVELDDASHTRRDRQDRDTFVNQVFETAGLPLLHVRAAAGYNPPQIAALVRQAIGDCVVPDTAIERSEDTPLCPKCDSQMVLRTATKGSQQGEKFWGCGNFPRCREIVQF